MDRSTPLISWLLLLSGCAVTGHPDYPSTHQDTISSGPSIASTTQSPNASSVSGYTSEVDRIRAISDPNQRAAANLAFVQSLVGNLNASMVEAGINPNEMAYQSNYDAARRHGRTPAEANAEAMQFMQTWQEMSR